MDDNNAQDNHNPPSQRNKISRAVGGSKKRQLARAGALAAAGPLGVAALEGSTAVKNTLSRNSSQDTLSQDINQPPTLSPNASQENSENNSESETNQDAPTETQDSSTTQKTTLRDDAKKLGNIAAKTAQYATPAGLAYTGIKRMRSGIRSNYGNSKASDSPTFSAPSKQASISQNNGVRSFKKGLASASGKVFLYGPGGFILGRIAPRLKERIFARQEVEKIEKEAREKANKKTATDKKTSENLKINTQRIFKGVFYATPVGLTYYLGKKYLPASVKNRIKKILPQRITQRTRKNGSSKQNSPPEKKNAKQYQKEWNQQTIAKAILGGYNPKALFSKIRDMKVWQTRAWKYGKYAILGPAVAGGIDAYKHSTGSHENIDRHSNQAHSSGGSKSSPTRAWQGYSREGSSGPIWNRFVSQKFSNLNQKLGSKFGGKASKNAANTLAKNAGKKLAGQAVKQLQEKLVTSVLANPPVLIGIGVVFLVFLCVAGIIIIIASISGGGGGGNIGGFAGGGAPGGPPINANPIPGFTIDKSVEKSQYTFGSPPEPIVYTITYSYSQPTGSSLQLSNITIYDKLPVNTNFVSASGTGKYDSITNTVSWDLSDTLNTSPITLTLTPTQDNIIISNTAYASAASSSGSPPTSSSPNSSNCAGVYTLDNPIGNFGDPNCTLASISDTYQRNDLIRQRIQSEDPKNVDFWFHILIPCESGFNPNAFNGNSTSGTGAFGLFQVNRSGKSTSGEFDVGDVEWPVQVFNATSLARSNNGDLSYWYVGCRNGIPSLQY